MTVLLAVIISWACVFLFPTAACVALGLGLAVIAEELLS